MLGAVWNLFDGWDATDTSLAISAGALGIAAWALGMSFSEHREFLARLRARADFTGTVKFPPADDTDGDIVTLVTEGNGGTIRIEVGLKNQGNRAAGLTVLNLIAPAWTRNSLSWSGPQGQALDVRSPPAPTDEQLTDPTGASTDAVYLALELPRVARRPHYVKFARLNFDVAVGGERWLPVRFTAQADELPDDVDELSVRRTLRILHASHPEA
jgi:hypothetical protein